MCERKERVSLSDLILAAVCYLQEKNGVTACDIAEFVARKRGCKLEQIEGMIKLILCKAKNFGILCEKKGFYRIQERFDDLPPANDQGPVCISEDSEEEDDNGEEEEEEQEKTDPCACLKFSQDCLEEEEEEEEENICNKSNQENKKRKCG